VKKSFSKWIDDLLTSIGSKCSLPVGLYYFLCFVDLRFYKLYFGDPAKQLGEVIKLRAGATKDPLMDTVGIL
jgi:hypothetical protein